MRSLGPDRLFQYSYNTAMANGIEVMNNKLSIDATMETLHIKKSQSS